MYQNIEFPSRIKHFRTNRPKACKLPACAHSPKQKTQLGPWCARIIIRETEKIDNTWDNIIHKKYTLNGNTLSSEKVTTTSEYWFNDYTYTAIRGAAQIDSDGNYYSDIGGQMWIKQTSDGTVSFGKTGNSTAPLIAVYE